MARHGISPYSYNLCELENASRDIRLMVIKGLHNGVLEVELNAVDLSNIDNNKSGNDEYVALSWCWRAYGGEDDDDSQQLQQINIMKDKYRYSLDVSRNLNAALKVLHDLKVLQLWVDWICIDQSNTVERSNQVRLMGQVYGKAESVYVWLGEEKNNSKLAFEFIPKMLEVQGFNDLVTNTDNHESLNAVKMLLTRDWFSRRWIIQEIALAEKAVLVCGMDQLKWSTFAIAVSLFTEYETQTRGVSKVMKSLEKYDNHPDHFGYLPTLSAAHLVEITNKLFRKRNDGHLDRLLSLEYLVSTFITFNSSEARDTVYAILTIAKDTAPQTAAQVDTALTLQHVEKTSKQFARILRQFAAQHLVALKTSKPYNVDYDQPISDIYVEFIKFCIERAQQLDPTRALDILCRPWAPDPDFPEEANENPHWRVKFTYKKNYKGEREIKNGIFVLQSPRTSSTDEPDIDTIPSWVRSKDHFSHGYERRSGEGNIKMKRRNADPLVGNPSQRLYSASGSKGVTKTLRFQDGRIDDPEKLEHNHHYHSIFLEGFVLGTIARLADRSQRGVIPKTWADLCKANLGRANANPSTPLPAQFWDTSQSNDFWRTLIGDQSWKGQDAPRFYHHIIKSQYEGIDDVDLSDLLHYDSLKCDPAKDVCQRVQSVIWDRKLMVVEYKTRPSIGQAPQHRVNPTLGLAPSEAQPNDLVCILYGCSVPVVLREYEKSPSVLKSQISQREKELQKKAYNMLVNAYFARKCKIAKDRCAERQTPTPTTPAAGQRSTSTPRSNAKRERATRATNSNVTPSKRRRTNQDPAPTRNSTRKQAQTPRPTDQSDNDRTLHQDKTLHQVEPKFYKMIGECYVHGMMRGEAIEHQNVERLEDVIFEIR